MIFFICDDINEKTAQYKAFIKLYTALHLKIIRIELFFLII